MLGRSHITGQRFLAAGIMGFAAFLCSWQLVIVLFRAPPLLLPSPLRVVQAGWELTVSGQLFWDILASVARIGGGMALSALLAIPLGVLLALSPRAEAFAFPMVGFLRYIPPSAFVPLFILWFGIGDFEKILVVFIAVAPYLLLLVFDIVKGVENDLLEAAYTLGATDRQVLFRVIFPATLPEIWDALRVMVGIAWSFVVLAEVVAATSGLGHLIITAQRFIQTARMIAAIVVIGLLGILTDYAFAWLRKRLFPWARQLSHA